MLSASLAVGVATGPAQAQSINGSMYSKWSNGPPTAASFFPLAVWYQAPTLVGKFGAYPSLAAAAAGEKINIFLGIAGMGGGPVSWPEAYGHDNGELEAIKANGLYLIGGLNTPSAEDTSAHSVSSMLALAGNIGATSNLIGYNAGDEPTCAQSAAEPAAVAALQSYDPTRIVAYNEAHWMLTPAFAACLSTHVTGMQSASVASSDLYPVIDAWLGGSPGFPKSDFLTYPNDTLFLQGVMVQAIAHYSAPGQPVWAFVDAGANDLKGAEGPNFITASVTGNSRTLTLNYNWTKFTSLWLGLTLNGPNIPAGTTIAAIIDSKHLTMSKAATATASGEKVYVQGGQVNSDCVLAVNICVVQGNEYRATSAQVNAGVWNSIINGANGIEYFCHDTTSYSLCLGGGSSPLAIAVQQNLTYVNTNVLAFAPMLNATTVGQCSMQHQNYTTTAGYTTTSWCTGGILTMATVDASVPGLALVKSYNGATYLFAQSDRRSRYGAWFHFTLAGLANQTATVAYDSDGQYDPAHSSLGLSIPLSAAGYFSDTLGANNDHYQVKIYKIQ